MPRTSARNHYCELGKAIDIRLSVDQDFWLKKHRFGETEAISQVINRQLRRLALAVQTGSAPELPEVSYDTKPKHYQIKLEVEAVEPFVDRIMQEQGLASRKYALEFLIPWASKLPITQPLLTAEAALHFLKDAYGQEAEDLVLKDVMGRLVNTCSVQDAKSFLWELHQSGKVRLTSSRIDRAETGVIWLPDYQSGASYARLNLLK